MELNHPKETERHETKAVKINWPLILILLVAFGLRLINLNGRFLWYDEAIAILFAEKSLAAMLDGTITLKNGSAANVHPLLYFWLLHGWMRLVGTTPFAIRLLSALLGTATVFVTYLTAKELRPSGKSGSAPLLAAVFITISPFHIYYSQETRMYALLGLCTLLSTLFWLRAWHDNRWQNWILYAIFGTLALYSHSLGALYLASIGLWTIWRWLRAGWVRWRGVVGANLLLLLLYTPWLTVLPSQLSRVQQGYWVTRPGLVEMIQTLLAFHVAYDNQALPSWLLPLAIFFSLLVPILFLLTLSRTRGLDTRFTLLCATSLLPPLLGLLISQIQPIYTLRAFLPSAITYYIVLAAVFAQGVMPKPIRWLVGSVAALVVIGSLVNHYTYANFPRPPFAAATDYLAQQYDTATDVIIHSNKLSFLPTHYYDRNLAQQFVADPLGSPSDTLGYATQEALGLFSTADLETAVGSHATVHFVIFDRAIAETGTDTHPHLVWLNGRFRQEAVVQFNDLAVYTFIRRN